MYHFLFVKLHKGCPHNNHDWRNASGPNPTIILLERCNSYTNVCKCQLQYRDKNNKYGLSLYYNPFPQSIDEVYHLLRCIIFVTTTTELDKINYGVDLEQIRTQTLTNSHQSTTRVREIRY